MGNQDTTAGTDFIGTTNNVDFSFRKFNIKSGILETTSTAFDLGSFPLKSATVSVTKYNIAIEPRALRTNVGSNNTAIGPNAYSVVSV